MGRTGPIHGFGVFLLFAASILVLITTISAPVVNSIAILQVSINNGSNVNFGTFGWCVTNAAQPNSGSDYCTGRTIGYDAATETANFVLSNKGGTFDHETAEAANKLTNVMILHPITAGVTFLACLVAIGAGCFGSILSFLVALVSWGLTLVAMAIDLVAFGYLKNSVNNDSTALDATANWSHGLWTLLAAFIILFFGMFIVLFTCCSARRHRDRDVQYSPAPKNDYGNPNMMGGGRWQSFRRGNVRGGMAAA